jgi:hypothetical protein
MKLLLENWREYQLLTEVEDIRALYESGQITEGEFLDKVGVWAKKKGVPIAVALSLFTGGVAGGTAQTKQSWEDHYQSLEDDDDSARVSPDNYRAGADMKKIQDYPLEAAPTLRGKGTGRGFLYVPAKYISDSAYLGDSSAYATAGEYRKTVKTNSLDLLIKQLFGKDSGAIFGGGSGPTSLTFEKSKDGKNILPLEWSLSYEALMDKIEARSS